MNGKTMRRIAPRGILALLVLVLCANILPVDAQELPLPARAMQRIGTTKLRHGSRILCLAYSHDGQWLAAGGGNDPLRLWNPKTGELIRELNEPWVHAMALSPSGETLLFGGFQKSVRMWNFRLNKETGRLDGHKATVKAIAVAPDASIIVTGSQDGVLARWDMNTKTKLSDMLGHTDEINAIAFFADKDNATFVASAGGDRSIIIWNMNVEPPTIKLKIDAGCGVHSLVASADGNALYSAGDDNLIRRWDCTKGMMTGSFRGHEGIVVSLALQGDTLISGSLDRTVRYWDTKTTNSLRSMTRAVGDCDAFAVTKAGDFLATAGLNNTIRIFETSKFQDVTPGPGLTSGLTGLVLSPDNKRLAAISADGQVLVWEPTSGKILRQWDSKLTGDVVLAFAPDGRTLITASSPVRFWNSEAGDLLFELPTKSIDPPVAIAMSPDGNTLALGMHSTAVELWDLKERKNVGAFKYPGALHALAWSPDGKKLAAGGGARIVVWDPQAREVYKSFNVKEGPAPTFPTVKTLVFAPNSTTLAAGGFDAITRLYNLNAMNPTEAREQRTCEGHVSAIYSLAFSRDGRTLITGSFDKTVRLWEAFSGKQISVFNAHRGEIGGVAISRDGRSAFSAGADAVIYQWDVPGIQVKGNLPDITLGQQELDDAWTTLLTEETPRGHELVWRCIASGKQAVPFLTKQKKLYLLDPDRVKKLIRDLDSTHYPTRMASMAELSGYGRWMEGRFDAAIANPLSLEYKRRVELLKEKLSATNSPSLAQERLRMWRIMLICEQVGGPEAMEALQQLAARGPEEDIRADAAAALERLRK
ncbi:MAG: hypothetical protein FJ303_09775 [Planctomycetes bacterium]|nr:hypothetical protein [Planctomycetota bacterium]